MNRLSEIYTLVSALDPDALGTDREFRSRFRCEDKMRQLNLLLRGTVLVRRLKHEVLEDLPPKRRSVIVLPKEVAKEAVEEEKQILTFHAKELHALAEEVTASVGDDSAYKRAAQKLREARVKAQGSIFGARHRVAMAKLPAVMEHLDRILDEGVKKLVVWCHHRDVVSGLQKRYGSAAVTLSGGTPPSERLAARDRFQNDPGCRIFIGSIHAAGLGISLTTASHIVFAELDWGPTTLTQAEDRCHRIGQRQSILIEHLVVDESLDARMAKLIVEKQKLIRDVLDVGATKEETGLDLALAVAREAA